MRAIVLALGLCLISSPGWTQVDDSAGTMWLLMCEARTPDCDAYLAGIHYAHEVISVMKPQARVYCAPSGATPLQLRALVIKFMQENPQHLHVKFAALAIASFAQAFPCPKGK